MYESPFRERSRHRSPGQTHQHAILTFGEQALLKKFFSQRVHDIVIAVTDLFLNNQDKNEIDESSSDHGSH